MASRALEAGFILIIMLTVVVGGWNWLIDIVQFHGIVIAVLGIIAVMLVYAFRRNFVRGGPLARLHATRDAAFLAAIGSAVAFVAAPARWSHGAAIAAVEFALVVELMSRFVPVPVTGGDE